MNHDEKLEFFMRAYALLLMEFIDDINSIKDPKHKIERQQDLDKVIHYFRKTLEGMRDLNSWFTAFGSPEEKA